MICPYCTQEVDARRTLPGNPVHIKTHWHEDEFCPPLETGRQHEGMMIIPPVARKADPEVGQLSMFG